MPQFDPYATYRGASSLIRAISDRELSGRVSGASASLVSIEGLGRHVSVGCRLTGLPGYRQPALEVVRVSSDSCSVMPTSLAMGMRVGDRVLAPSPIQRAGLAVSRAWLGRVVGPDGAAIDGRGALDTNDGQRLTSGAAIFATDRMPLGGQMVSGIIAMDLFIPCRFGQRLGVFAGTGVGKSSLMSQLAAYAAYDVLIVALIGERGREVKEMIAHLGASGRMDRAIVVVATSDMTGFEKRDAAVAAVCIAEYFRDSGSQVLLLFDSVSRFCDALREIALAGGELPSAMGFPPSVFQNLARLVERIGPGAIGQEFGGTITGIFTALLDGDEQVNPIADAVRGMLDGHVFLSRRLANRGHFPAVDVLSSVSRCAGGIFSVEQDSILRQARLAIGAQEEAQDAIAAGLYRRGENAANDRAVQTGIAVMSLLRQGKSQGPARVSDAFQHLQELVAV